VTVKVCSTFFLFTDAALQLHLRTGVLQVMFYAFRAFQLKAVGAF